MRRPAFSFGGTGDNADTIFRSGFDTAGAQTLIVTATTDPALVGAAFGELVFHEANGAAPDAHMPIAVKGTAGGDGVGVSCYQGACTFRVDSLVTTFNGIGCVDYCGLVWLNRYTPDPADFPITITSISTIFGASPGWNAPGDRINFYVYIDSDTNPSNGATLVGQYQGYTIVAPSDDFTTISLPTPIVVNGPGDILIALTNPGPNIGSRPIAGDVGPNSGRSWIGGFDDAGVEPNLGLVGLVPASVALQGFHGNWIVRAAGTNALGQPIVLGMPAKQ
jgi:hypothetical protein